MTEVQLNFTYTLWMYTLYNVVNWERIADIIREKNYRKIISVAIRVIMKIRSNRLKWLETSVIRHVSWERNILIHFPSQWSIDASTSGFGRHAVPANWSIFWRHTPLCAWPERFSECRSCGAGTACFCRIPKASVNSEFWMLRMEIALKLLKIT